MEQQLIEKAALEHAGGIPQSDERKEYSRYDFIAGAKWRINSVWHDASEKPDYRRYFVYQAIRNSGEVFYHLVCIYGDDEWDFINECDTMECWAYIDDLLPERKNVDNG